ncbi:hypothetical protein B0H14DRAFT_3426635 [Mycena olivaceomarginata]|nr:hypothetical protein B0H14DRAFT_3426635 [Mycena olivaceomarginata]
MRTREDDSAYLEEEIKGGLHRGMELARKADRTRDATNAAADEIEAYPDPAEIESHVAAAILWHFTHFLLLLPFVVLSMNRQSGPLRRGAANVYVSKLLQLSLYHAHPRPQAPAAPHPQFVIPEERTQMAQLLGMVQMLLNNTAELKERMSSVEKTLSFIRPPTPVRGIAAQRGRGTRAKNAASGTGRQAPASPPESDASDTDTLAPTSTTGLSTDTVAESDEVDETNTRPNVPQRQKRALHYPTQIFDARVDDHRNQALFQTVADRVFSELKNRDPWPKGLTRPLQIPGPTFNIPLLQDLGKKSFRSLKKQWKEVKDVEAAIKADKNEKTPPHDAPPAHASAAEHGLHPAFLADLIHEEFLSDEVSEPEDGSHESKDAWKVRLAAAADLPLDPDAQSELKVLEILVPAWRSDAVLVCLQ